MRKIVLYGIKSCTTVRKARDFLEGQHIDFFFYDYKSKGVNVEILRKWVVEKGWETVLNKKSRTWLKQDDATHKKVIDAEAAIRFMCQTPTVIKRPILEIDSEVLLLGFDETTYRQVLSSTA